MAEFQEVMRQFDRMCKAHAGCVDCPLAIKGTVETKCGVGSFVDEPEYIEREVMSWAAEHPEPVYPTWYEVMAKLSVIDGRLGDKTLGEHVIEGLIHHRIPADIAHKLGIKPKDVK